MFLVICAAGGGALVVVQALLSALALGVHHGPHVGRHSGGRSWGHRGARGAGRGAGRWRAAGHRSSGSKVNAAPAAKGPVVKGPAHGLPRGVTPAHATAQAKAAAAVAAARTQPGHRHHGSAGSGGDSLAWIWLHSIVNFQGLVAGLTVLGLAGLAANAGGLAAPAVVGIALGAGLAMMMVVAGILTAMVNMDQDGTMQMEQAVGALGEVYLSIPASQTGLGKVMVTVRGRTMEFGAVSYEERPMERGEPVMVVGVQENGVVEVVSGKKYLSDLAPAKVA
ncbi:MAG TPA: hypothetical protein VH253_14550 [Phycisphaerae bacterium]|nr:hypothetical protein [Phycisphaerae bacterium]